MRKLRHHEQRLLRHVDFSTYASEAGSKQGHSHREAAVLRRFHITNRNDYTRYNRVVGLVTKLSSMLRDLDRDSPARVEMTNALLDKLYAMGILTTRKSLVQCAKLSTASFVRRRLAVVMVRLKMAENLREATEFIEQVRPRNSDFFFVLFCFVLRMANLQYTGVLRIVSHVFDNLQEYSLRLLLRLRSRPGLRGERTILETALSVERPW